MVPPPLSFSDITMAENIVNCSVSLSGNRIAILTALSIEIYEWSLPSKPATRPRRLASFYFEVEAENWSNTRSVQIQAQSEDSVRLLSYSRSGGSKITSFAIDESKATLKYINLDIHAFDGDRDSLACNIFTDNKKKYLWWQTADGIIGSDRPGLSYSSVVHPAAEVMLVEGPRSNSVDDDALRHDDQPPEYAHIISLSAKGELLADDKLLSRGCTSFVTTDAYLIFTTSQHLLKFVHIDASHGGFETIHPYQWLTLVQSMKFPVTLRKQMNGVERLNEEPS
jgi:elongator complex protein 1